MQKYLLTGFSLAFLTLMLGCQSAPKAETGASGKEQTPQAPKAQGILTPYSEFSKILTPQGGFMPLPGGKAALVLMLMPGDAYTKLYRLDYETKTFKKEYDHGRAIKVLTRDPKLKRIFLLIDQNGDENNEIYEYDLASQKVTHLFGTPGFTADIAAYPKNEDELLIRSNHEDKKLYAIYHLDLLTHKATRLTPKDQSWDGAELSLDSKTLILTRAIGNNETHVYKQDLATGVQVPLLQKKATNYNVSFIHPKKPILFINSNDGRDRTACAQLDLAAKTPELKWIRVDPKKDLNCYYNKTSGVTVVQEDYDGQIRVRLFEGVFDKEINTPFPKKVIASNYFKIPGEDLAYIRLISSTSPGDFYQFKPSQGKKAELKKVSQLNVSCIPDQKFAESYDFNFRSFDGLKIHSIIYAKKEWLTESKKYPVILWPHGGPDGNEVHAFRALFQYWAQNGYVVFAPNFRGSAGYGKKFETLNDKDWGGGHIKDLVWGKRALTKLTYIDPSRVFIVGASFGGFSTLSALTQYSSEFKGGVAIMALANLFTFFKSIPPDPAWQNEFLTEMGDPIKDEALYRERSPYFNAKNISIPLKIYQAENDIRTVKPEMDSFVEELKRLNIPVEYEILKNEGHGLSRAETRQMVFEGTLEFLNRL